MRTWTTAEERAYDTTEPKIEIKVEIEDGSATLQNWCDLDGACFVESIAWSDNLDQPMASGEAVIDWQRTEYDGMSPFVTGGRYEGYLAEWREIVISTRVYPHGADASAFSWREVFRGRVDKYDLSSSPGKILFRDKIGAELMDQQLMSVEAYGDDDGAKDIEDVIGDILTDHDKTSATLETPVATAYQVKRYNQTKMRLLQALRNLAFTIGWDLRSKWNESGSAFKLTLYEPDRTISTADHTISPGFIRSWNEFGSSVENIRNAVRVWYGDITDPDADGEPGRKSVVRTATTSPAHDLSGSAVASSSIAKYGWRLMEIAEASSSVVSDATAATNLADYAIADLASPTVIGHCTLAVYFWPVELNDYYDFTADGVRLGSDTKAAIHGYSHSLSPGGGASTELFFRAKPGLGPAAYFSRSGNAILQPDDKAPDAPTVALRQTPLGVLAEVVTTRLRDFDRVLFHVGTRSDFTPNAESLVQSSRSTTYAHQLKTGVRREWLKVQIRDLVGNISATAGPFPLVAKKTDARQLSQPLQAKTQLGFYADSVVTGYGKVIFDKYDAGEFLGDYNLATGRFFAREGGTYRVALSGKLSTSMTEGTDYFLSLRRDPDGDNAEVARAVVTGGVFQFDAFVPLDADDELELAVVDPGAGSFSNVTFDSDYTKIKLELVGTQQRSKPYPFVEADPVFLDHGPSGNYSSAVGECHTVFRLSTGEVLFANGAAGGAHPVMLHRNEVDANKARSITYSGSTDYWFSGACETSDRNIILCTHKEDSTITYGLRKYAPGDLSSSAASSDLGSTIEPRCVCHADNVIADNPCFLGTVESGGVGKVRSYKTSDLSVKATSADLGGGVNSIAHLNPQESGGGVVVAMLSSATAPDIVALDANDVTAAEIWRLQLDALATPGTSDDACELKTSPDDDTLYAIGGTTNPTLYAISPTGGIVWSEDLGAHSELTDITGCLSLDVHPTTGDIAVLCYYDDAGTYELDCVTFDPDGNKRWTWRGLGELDPADDPDWTSSTTGHRIAFATDGAIWVSGGGSAAAKAKIIKPFAEIPSSPPSIPASALVADFDAEALNLADGAAVTNWTANRDRRSKTLADGLWRLENDTAGEQPTFRGKWRAAAVDGVAREQTKFAAVEFDGTERMLGNIETTIVSDGAICVLVCEPVDTTGDYFSAYADTGSASSPLIELENAASRLTFRVNVDGVQDTHWDHASRAGLQVVGCRGASLTEAGIWLNNAKPNQTSAQAGTDPTPDGNPRIRLGQARSGSGDWFAGWVYRWIWVNPSAVSASRVASIVHWARAYYEIPEVAVEEPAGVGDTIAIENSGPVQYFTSGIQEITHMNARNLSGQCLISRRLGDSSAPHYHLIDDTVSQVWVMSSSNLYSFAGRHGGSYIYEDGSYALVCLDGTDGVTYGSAGRCLTMRLDMTDGSQNWVTAPSHGGEGSAMSAVNSVDADESGDKYCVEVGAPADEIKQGVASTGVDDSVSGNDTGAGSGIGAMCLTPDKDYIAALGYGSTPELVFYTFPLTSTAENWYGHSTNDLKLDGSSPTYGSTNDMGYAARLGYGGRTIPARDGTNHVYVCPGYFGTVDNRYVMRAEPPPAGGGYGQIVNEVDAVADADLTPDTYNFVLDVQCDQYGNVYALVMAGSSGANGWDVVRYDPDLTNPFSFSSDGGVTMPAIGTYGLPTRLAIDEADSVYVGTRDGYVTVFSQT